MLFLHLLTIIGSQSPYQCRGGIIAEAPPDSKLMRHQRRGSIINVHAKCRGSRCGTPCLQKDQEGDGDKQVAAAFQAAVAGFREAPSFKTGLQYWWMEIKKLYVEPAVAPEAEEVKSDVKAPVVPTLPCLSTSDLAGMRSCCAHPTPMPVPTVRSWSMVSPIERKLTMRGGAVVLMMVSLSCGCDVLLVLLVVVRVAVGAVLPALVPVLVLAMSHSAPSKPRWQVTTNG